MKKLSLKGNDVPVIWREVRRTIVLVFSSIIYSIGIVWFLEVDKLYSGGVSGISQLICNLFYKYANITLNLGLLVFILNVPLVILGWFCVGKKFTIYSLVSVLIQSIMLGIIPRVQITMPDGVTPLDMLTNAIVGGALVGIGVGLPLRFGTSTGGLDILSQYLSFKKGLTVGMIGLCINLLITIMSGIHFGFTIAIYTMIRMIISMVFTDKIHTSYNYLNVEVITEYGEIMSETLMDKTFRGITLLKAEGAFSHHDKTIVYCIISSYELDYLVEIVKGIDNNAFVVVKPVKKIIGNFRRKVIN